MIAFRHLPELPCIPFYAKNCRVTLGEVLKKAVTVSCSLFVFMVAHADTITVGTEDSNFLSIQEAVLFALPGDTILVRAGNYDEAVLLTQSVNLLGANAGIDPNTGTRTDETTLTGGGSISIFGNAQGVVIDGFEFTATEGALAYEHGAILIPPREDGGTVGGEPFNVVANIAIRNNWFHDLAARPFLKDCFATFTNLEIVNNRIENVGESGSDRTGIKIQSRCQTGTQSSGLTIQDNVIKNTTYAGIIVDSVSELSIVNNSINSVPMHGINIGASYAMSGALTISGNDISEAALPDGSAAIRIKGGTYTGPVRVELNSLKNSRVGLKFESGVRVLGETIIRKNRITGNTSVAGLLNASNSVLDARQNWWGDDTGPSGEGGGDGDAVGSDVDFSSWCLQESCLSFLSIRVCSVGCDFTAIQDAIDAAASGSSIVVGDGTYERFTITKPLSLRSENGAGTTFVSGAGVNQGWGTRIAAGVNDVKLGASGQGFTVNALSNDLTALYLVQENGSVSISGNVFNGGSSSALITGGLMNSVVFSENTFTGSGPHAVAYINGATSLGDSRASNSVSLLGNRFYGAEGAGLLLGVEADNSVITGNSFSGLYSYASLELWAAGGTIRNNSFLATGSVTILDSQSYYSGVSLLADNTFGKAVAAASVGTIFTSIQPAIDSATNGDTIKVAPGTYAEALVIDKSISLIGSGDSAVNGSIVSIEGAGAGITISASDVLLQDIRIDKGDAADLDDGKGLEISGSSISNIRLIGVSITGATNGLRIGSGTSVDGLTVHHSHFDSNDIAWYIANETAASSSTRVTNLAVTETTFNNNGRKGIYAEKLDHASFNNIEVHNSGVASNYLFNSGIDINLKWSSYSDISITNSTFVDSGRFIQLHNGEDFSAALAIKARDDGNYSSPPASLSGVTISGNSFTSASDDFVTALRLGEPAADNAGPSNVSISSNTFLGFSAAFKNATQMQLGNTVVVSFQPQSTLSGQPIAGTPGVKVTDIVGQPVSGVSVMASTTEGVTLGAVTTDSSGFALFTNLTIAQEGVFKLVFTITGTSTLLTSSQFEVFAQIEPEPVAPDPVEADISTNEIDNLVDDIEIDDEVSEEVLDALSDAAEAADNLAQTVVDSIDEVDEDSTIDALTSLSKVAEVSGQAAASTTESGNKTGAESAAASGIKTIEGFAKVLSALDSKVASGTTELELSPTQKTAVQEATVKAVSSAVQVLLSSSTASTKSAVFKNLGVIVSSSVNLGVTLTAEESTALFEATEQSSDSNADLDEQLESSIPLTPKNKALVSKAVLGDALQGTGVSEAELDGFLTDLANAINPADVNIGGFNGLDSLNFGFNAALESQSGSVEFNANTGVILFSISDVFVSLLENVEISALNSAPQRVPARVVSANIVSSSFPNGIRVKADGAVVVTTARVASIIVPASYDPINLYADLRKLGHVSSTEGDGNVIIRDADLVFSATFDFVGIMDSNAEQPSTTFTLPSGRDESDVQYKIVVNYRDGSSQVLQPFVAAGEFISSLKGKDIAVSMDRNNGTILSGGKTYRPSYFLTSLDVEASNYWGKNKDEFGIAYRVLDVNGDGLLDLSILSVDGSQAMYRVSEQ